MRGTTLVELMMAMVVLGFVMSLAAFEFQSVVAQHSFVESHLSAEQQSRIAIARVTGAVRQASAEVTDFPGTPAPPVINPVATPGNAIEYYQVSGLSPGLLPIVNGRPEPCYNDVTIQYQKPSPGQTEGEITEDVKPVAAPCPQFTYPPTTILAQNVEGFTVSPNTNKNAFARGYDISLTIKYQLPTDVRQVPTEYTFSTTVSPLVWGASQ